MYNPAIVRRALMKSRIQLLSAADQDSIISVLIHDIFGGEILKTKRKGGWHFYNRVDGLRLDFSKPDFGRSSETGQFEDIPASHHETSSYFEAEQYSPFLYKFISYFEEFVGLKKEYLAEKKSRFFIKALPIS